jgi:hypothetical protein
MCSYTLTWYAQRKQSTYGDDWVVVDRVGVKSAPAIVFVKDPDLEAVIYHGMNYLPSLPLLIL